MGKSVYQYDEETKKFKGIHDCQSDPVGGGYLYPGNYVDFVPTEIPGENQSNFLNDDNSAWVLKPDYTGATVYNIKTREEKRCEFINIPDGYTALAPATKYDEWNGSAWVTNETEKTIAENNAADDIAKAEILDIERKINRSIRAMLNILLTGGSIDMTSEDYLKFIEYDEAIATKREFLITKG